MLLQKTGLRIKKFICQKDRMEKPRSDFDNDDFTDNGLSPNTTQRLSWLSQTSSAETPLEVRRASSNITTRSNHFTPSSKTAHSSASSLCSCDCEANPASIEHSLFGVDPLPPHPEILYLPPLPSGHTTGDAKTWSLIFQEPSRRPLTKSELRFGRRTTSAAKFGPGSPFDVSGVLSADLLDDDKTPTQSLRYTGSDMENPPESVADSVEQLIRETDMAFQAVGTALADARAATEEWDKTGSPLAPRSSSVARGLSKRQPRPVISPLKTPVTRAMSVSRGKRSRFSRRKATFFGKSNPRGPASSQNTPARWTLTDATTNMADLFSGKMFRTEVDEMLTPGRIQQLKDKHESERKISIESAHSYETDSSTPTETFHLPSKNTVLFQVQYCHHLQYHEEALAYLCSCFHPAEWSQPSSPALTPPTHIILPSTHYTLTSPLFRHGPIRLERLIRDRRASCPDDAAEALDWTAFQMAISGTMQDGTHDTRDDSEWEADEAEIDGIVDWYRGFGFRGYGRIETEADVRARDELEIRRSRFTVRRRGGRERRSLGGSSSSWSPSQLTTGRSWEGPLLPRAAAAAAADDDDRMERRTQYRRYRHHSARSPSAV
ncbi:hypothetical protein MBM_03383 [Drepanopeziza brunnea f. sp. 'multigermtubi' MB_m1]|uniref:Uncharacterized protein n=1 Tax=Marssonina brunnea f. sp. multigermtubi (strain MB_m1) TaxID=1072389 RepID=K1WL08_MARBU|nr:uncharacterized protein MBM_03383 [Drepanopeziza brunnea f. sp. 'multigermtubi' MB_m1]EKD18390.1 hypothetical protein MBM_03383 [Drepanopeziza brunnea f. sp. 'multigermtubi' MB_m1]